MFHKILAAIDTSSMSQEIFDRAVSLAKTNNANLMLLHVLANEMTSPSSILPSLEYYPAVVEKNLELYREYREELEERGLNLLRSHQKTATAAGVKTEFSQNVGVPGMVICEFARIWKADLIVMGRRGISGLSELFLGSVSNYVLHHAPCAVLVVQQSANLKNEPEPSKIDSLTQS